MTYYITRQDTREIIDDTILRPEQAYLNYLSRVHRADLFVIEGEHTGMTAKYKPEADKRQVELFEEVGK